VASATKERKRSKYKSDEVESMDKVQMLGEAFQKIQAATGIHVRWHVQRMQAMTHGRCSVANCHLQQNCICLSVGH
jgi:hypothetical protein